MYFILVHPFCFGLFVFHLAPRADFLRNEIFLFVSAVGTDRLREPVLFRKKIVLGIRSRGPFLEILEIPGKFSGPKSNIQIEI